MSKVYKFCLEKEKYLNISEFKYSLLSLHNYLLPICRASAERMLTLFSKLYGFCCCLKFGKTDLDQELKSTVIITVVI